MFLDFLRRIYKDLSFINNFNRITFPHRSKSGKFMRNLFISYFIIVVICISIMGILSYSFERSRIVDLTIKSNNELLNHFKGTIDELILGNLDKMSLNILQNVISDPDTSYYFSNTYYGNTTGLLKVMDYLNKQKMTNPMLSSIAIYFSKNDLLATTEGIVYESGQSLTRDYIKKLIDKNMSSYWIISKERDKIYPDNGDKVYIYYIRKVAFLSYLSGSAGGLAISVDEDILHKIITGSAPTDLGDFFIIDENGIVISQNKKNYIFTSVKDIPYGERLLDSSKLNGSYIANMKGLKSLVSYTTSDKNGWKYITIKPIAKFNEGFEVLGRLILFIGFITFLFSLFASIISTRHFNNLMKRLGDLCRNIINVRPANKPKDEYELIGSTLGVVSDKLKESEQILEKSIPIIKHHFVNSLILPGYENKEEIYEKMKFLNIELPYTNYTLFILKLEKNPAFTDYSIYEYIKLEIINEIENVFSAGDMKCVSTEIACNIVAVINYSDKIKDLTDLIRDFSKYLNSTLKLDTYIGVGSSCYSVIEVYKIYSEADSYLNYSFLYPEIKIFTADLIYSWEAKNPESGKALLNDLCNSLKAQDKKATLSCLHHLFDSITNEHYPYNYTMKLLTKFSSYTESMLDILKINKIDIIDGDFINCFNRSNNIYELEKWLEGIINSIFAIMDARKSEKVGELVAKVKEYIDANILDNDLSLNYAADHMGISPTYLSRIFKDETGMNFVDYLTAAKLQAAEKMVLTSNLKVEEITALVGYSSPQYFIKKFKAKYGSTPKEYRMMYLRKGKSVSL